MTALLVTCGALAREVINIRDRKNWDARVLVLPAQLHNAPSEIPGAVERRVAEIGVHVDPVVLVYGDCGTGGDLDRLLEARGWLGLRGPHCYAAYAGMHAFDQMMRDEPGTFFLTDFLAASFDHLVLEGLALDRFPELKNDYFGNYQRVVYLQQRRDPELLRKAQMASESIGLPLEIEHTGLRHLEQQLDELLSHPGHFAESPRTHAAVQRGLG
jgi:hypothetical protein